MPLADLYHTVKYYAMPRAGEIYSRKKTGNKHVKPKNQLPHVNISSYTDMKHGFGSIKVTLLCDRNMTKSNSFPHGIHMFKLSHAIQFGK